MESLMSSYRGEKLATLQRREKRPRRCSSAWPEGFGRVRIVEVHAVVRYWAFDRTSCNPLERPQIRLYLSFWINPFAISREPKYANLRISVRLVRARAGSAAKTLRAAVVGLSGVPQAGIEQAHLGRRFPAQGQRLVR